MLQSGSPKSLHSSHSGKGYGRKVLPLGRLWPEQQWLAVLLTLQCSGCQPAVMTALWQLSPEKCYYLRSNFCSVKYLYIDATLQNSIWSCKLTSGKCCWGHVKWYFWFCLWIWKVWFCLIFQLLYGFKRKLLLTDPRISPPVYQSLSTLMWHALFLHPSVSNIILL